MASLRRNRTMPTDGAIAKFLYTILKQLDLKSIDWQEVANGLDITNGHAARMRFSRFKQQMEGTTSQPRKTKPAAPRPRKAKPDKPPSSENTSQQQQPIAKEEAGVKGEPGIKGEEGVKSGPLVKAEPELEDVTMQDHEITVKPEPLIKEETKEEEGLLSSMGSASGAAMFLEPYSHEQQGSGSPSPAGEATRQLSPELFVAKEGPEEPIMKTEAA